MGEQKTWSVAQNALSIGGINIQAGAGTGSWIKVTPAGDWRTVTVGLQGDVTVSENPDRSAAFELSLLQSAEVNAQLQALLNYRAGVDGTIGIGAFQLTDIQSGSEISGDCVLTTPPDWDVQGEVQNCVWKGTILEATYRIGGTE